MKTYFRQSNVFKSLPGISYLTLKGYFLGGVWGFLHRGFLPRGVFLGYFVLISKIPYTP